MLFNEKEVAFAKDVKLHSTQTGDASYINALILSSDKFIRTMQLGSMSLESAEAFVRTDSPAGTITSEDINNWNNSESTSSFSGNIPVILSNGKTAGPYVNGDNFVFDDADVVDLITKLLQEVINPTFVAQTFTLSLPSYSIREVGVTFSGLMTGNFNRGKINGKVVSGIWQETEFQNYLAGEIESYEFDDVVNQNNSSNFSKVLIEGVNAFKGKVNYGIGPQPLNSINGAFGTSLASGSLTDTKNITAIYPYFYGTLLPTQSIDDIDLSTFVKVVATSNGTVSIPYSSVVDKKLVIVIPNTSTIKTKWYVDALNNGNIGGLGDTFSAPYTKNYNSPTFLWVGKDYKVYISDRTSLNTTIELRN